MFYHFIMRNDSVIR